MIQAYRDQFILSLRSIIAPEGRLVVIESREMSDTFLIDIQESSSHEYTLDLYLISTVTSQPDLTHMLNKKINQLVLYPPPSQPIKLTICKQDADFLQQRCAQIVTNRRMMVFTVDPNAKPPPPAPPAPPADSEDTLPPDFDFPKEAPAPSYKDAVVVKDDFGNSCSGTSKEARHLSSSL